MDNFIVRLERRQIYEIVVVASDETAARQAAVNRYEAGGCLDWEADTDEMFVKEVLT